MTTRKSTPKTRPCRLPEMVPLNHLVSPLGVIHRAGCNRTALGSTAQTPRTLGLYAAVYLMEGQGWFGHGVHRRRKVSAGDLIHIFPEIPHYYHPLKGTTWSEFHIVYEGMVFDALRAGGLLSDTHPVWHLKPVDYWLPKMYEIVSPEAGAKGQIVSPAASLKLLARWQEFLADACETWNETKSGLHPGDRIWLQAVEAALYPDPLQMPAPPAVARGMGLSTDAFRRKFYSLKKISPSGYQQRRRIHDACRLLAREDCLVKEAGERLGFSDAYHFSKRFKEIVGISPSEFQHQIGAPKK